MSGYRIEIDSHNLTTTDGEPVVVYKKSTIDSIAKEYDKLHDVLVSTQSSLSTIVGLYRDSGNMSISALVSEIQSILTTINSAINKKENK